MTPSRAVVVVEPAAGAARQRASEIRSAIEAVSATGTHLCLLLAIAHDERDWAELGYRGFGAYAATECGLGRAHAYRLIKHARVITALAEAAGVEPEALLLPEHMARRARLELPTITGQVRVRTQSRPPDARPAIVSEIVREATVSPAGDTRPRPDLARIVRALIDLERDLDDPQGWSALVADGIVRRLGDDGAARERWADYLTDAGAALRRAVEDTGGGSRRPPGSRARRRAKGSGDGAQLTIWDSLADSAAEAAQ